VIVRRAPPLATIVPFPVVEAAWRLALVPGLLAAATLLFVPPVGVGFAALTAGILWFHRDPTRTPPGPDRAVVSPADGTVQVVSEEGTRLRVGVFMNVTDVHVNRAPIAGTVREVRHRPGANRPAFEKESDRNEQVVVDFGTYEVIVIAGWFARRIHPHVETGDELDRGDRVGHVSFGSRADVVLPAAVDREDLLVKVGNDVRAGETIVAELPADAEDGAGDE
jgi:phosphatidylserine decarboxylase